MKQRTYKAIGINLKAIPMGEADKMVTVLTKERGIVRAIAPGARKHKSRLSGRSGLFVVNEILFIKGKSIDKLVQAETQQSFPGLSRDLAKLTASQYLAEIALAQALTDQPQEDLYALLVEHLTRLEKANKSDVLPCLAQATYHMLALAGVAPEVYRCCLSRSLLTPQLGDPDWQVAFSVSSGGAVDPGEIARLERDRFQEIEHIEREWREQAQREQAEREQTGREQSEQRATDAPETSQRPATQSGWKSNLKRKVSREVSQNLGIVGYLSGAELALMQQLSKPELVLTRSLSSIPQLSSTSHLSLQTDRQTVSQSGTIRAAEPKSSWPLSPALSASGGAFGGASEIPSEITSVSAPVSAPESASGPHIMWRHIEQFLRQYVQYQFDRPIKSAALIDTCFTPPTFPPPTHAARA